MGKGNVPIDNENAKKIVDGCQNLLCNQTPLGNQEAISNNRYLGLSGFIYSFFHSLS